MVNNLVCSSIRLCYEFKSHKSSAILVLCQTKLCLINILSFSPLNHLLPSFLVICLGHFSATLYSLVLLFFSPVFFFYCGLSLFMLIFHCRIYNLPLSSLNSLLPLLYYSSAIFSLQPLPLLPQFSLQILSLFPL